MNKIWIYISAVRYFNLELKVFNEWKWGWQLLKKTLQSFFVLYGSVVQGCFCWHSVDFPLVFWGVLLVFRGVPLFHHCSRMFHFFALPWCSLFHCSMFWRSWLYSMPFLPSVFECSWQKKLFTILLWREIDNLTFSFLNISNKNLIWKQHLNTDTSWN